MPYFFIIINLFLLATVKFFYTPISAFLLGLNLFEGMIITIAGGLFGFVFFYNLSYIIILSFQYFKPLIRKFTPPGLKHKYRIWKLKLKNNKINRKKFTKRNRFIVKTRTTYGKWGIMLLTPVFLSIPLGAFLLRKYYSEQKNTLPLSLLVITIEGVVISYIFWLIPLEFIKN
jgi:hypothetical protein